MANKPRPKRLTAPGVIGRKLYLGEWLLAGLCAVRGVGVVDVRSDSRNKNIGAVRREFCILAKGFNLGPILIGRLIHRGHATVLYHQSEVYRDRKLGKRMAARQEGKSNVEIRRGAYGRFCGKARGGPGCDQGAGGAGAF